MRTKILIAVLAASLVFTNAEAVTIKSGQVCKTANAQIKSGSKTFVCKKSGSKLTWQVKPKKPSIPATQPTTPTPAPKLLSLYTGGSGGTNSEKSFELPVSVAAAPAGSNLKLWIYHPSNKNQQLRSPGVWLKGTGEDWRWLSTNLADGSLYATLAPGSYVMDTVEPDNNQKDYGRITHSIDVDSSGKLSIRGMQPNSAGYYTLTVTDKRIQAAPFVPTNRCQVSDLGISGGGNVGFPKSLDRLTSNGTIRALILPIDFATLPGVGNPAEIFYQMADQMNSYYKAMSGNRVSFDYKTLANWHRVNFDPAKFNLGKWNGGDPGGYYSAALTSADSIVDYSQFDVVYVLSPKAVPSSVIAYGPAFPSLFSTNDGKVKNGTISGADAYRENERFAWQWMAHETGHLFGIYDLYTVDPQPNVYGDWDLMSNSWGNVLELNSWNRFIQGWLAENQIRCLEATSLNTPVEVTINPLSERNSELKSVIVRLSDSEVLVAEVRRNGGYDRMSADQQGVLVYKVDMKIPSIKGGYQTQRRPGSTQPQFLDALLKPKDKIKVGNVQIEVISSGANGDVVRVSN